MTTDLNHLSIFAHDEGVMLIDGAAAPQRRIMVTLGAIVAAIGVPPEQLNARAAENWVRIHVQRSFDAAARRGLAGGYARFAEGDL